MVKGGTQTQGQWKGNLCYSHGQSQLHCREQRTIATAGLPCSANPVVQIRFYTDPLLCVGLLQSRAGIGSGQGVLPDKTQDNFAVCAGLS